MKTDAEAAGFDPARLERVDEHLRTRYIEPHKIAGCQVAVFRHGELAHWTSLGVRDLERGTPVEDDTIWRLYSMSKPVTAVALLTLVERGMLQLADPVHRFVPEFRDTKVRERLDDGSKRLVDQQRPMSVRDALTHMTGIGTGPPTARFELARLASESSATRLPKGSTLESVMVDVATEPLVFHPGTHWLYTWSTDLVARIVEVVSGQRFDDYLRATIFDPLGMVDTDFCVPEAEMGRLAALYARDASKQLVLVDDPETSRVRRRPSFLSGNGGLVGTTGDYLRFARMLLAGGELDGVRILGRKTVELMTSNHLPGGVDIHAVAYPGTYGETQPEGMGFGLQVAVSKGPVATQGLGSAGEYLWGGAASTIFWNDPAEQLSVVFMTQLLPSATFNFRGQLKSIVYAAIAD
jgi:CubicO group peptidase (beta-lactamase class C family)